MAANQINNRQTLCFFVPLSQEDFLDLASHYHFYTGNGKEPPLGISDPVSALSIFSGQKMGSRRTHLLCKSSIDGPVRPPSSACFYRYRARSGSARDHIDCHKFDHTCNDCILTTLASEKLTSPTRAVVSNPRLAQIGDIQPLRTTHESLITAVNKNISLRLAQTKISFSKSSWVELEIYNNVFRVEVVHSHC